MSVLPKSEGVINLVFVKTHEKRWHYKIQLLTMNKIIVA
jgi:hypothetical protein